MRRSKRSQLASAGQDIMSVREDVRAHTKQRSSLDGWALSVTAGMTSETVGELGGVRLSSSSLERRAGPAMVALPSSTTDAEVIRTWLASGCKEACDPEGWCCIACHGVKDVSALNFSGRGGWEDSTLDVQRQA